MELSKKKAVIIAAVEGVYGADATPDGSNAIGVTDLKISPAKGTAKKRAIMYPDHSTQPHIITQQHQEVSLTVELKGGGAAGTVPECGPILRACMMSETIDPGVDVVYQLISDSYESCTIYVNQDGILHKLTGCRGTFKINGAAGDYPTMSFTLLALAVAPVDLAPVVPVYTTVAPLEINSSNTTFALGGFAALLHKLDLDPGVAVKYRELVNSSAQIIITGRDCKGSLTFDAIKNIDHNFWADWSASTPLVMALTHGATTGNIVEINAPKVQLASVDYGDADNTLTFNTPIALTRNTGDDEFTLTFK